MTEFRTLKNYHFLVFSDLDGTLLDHETYSFQAAIPAINALKEKDIPLIFCTSKTRAEIEKVRFEIGNFYPFICENGGAIFIPDGYFSYEFPFTRKDSNCFIIELGTSYPKLREALKQISASLPIKLKGFGDMSLEEAAHLCGFSLHQAELAHRREYDEPFLLEDESLRDIIQEIADNLKIQLSQGSRFYHLMGNNDKGKAILILKDIYRKKYQNIKTIAIGDSLNDLPMLQGVDYPVLVQKPDGGYDQQVKLDNLILACGKGPVGWNEAILRLLKEL